MNQENLEQQIRDLHPWYQRINLDGVMTLNKGGKYGKYFGARAGEYTWNTITKFLPPSLKGMRILDLGCNAGFYSIQSSLLGAKEVIGVDMSPIFSKQALFIREFFEKSYNKKMNITYIKSDIGNVDFDNMGDFDYVYAIAVLYHIGKQKYGKYTKGSLDEQKTVLRKLSNKTKKFIVRCRRGKFNSREYYSKIFKEVGFIESKFIPEGKRGMILYEKR